MTDDQTPLPDDEILRCGLCGREARIVRLRPGGIEHVIGRQRHPVMIGPAPSDGQRARTGDAHRGAPPWDSRSGREAPLPARTRVSLRAP